jgi:hypothetical protein
MFTLEQLLRHIGQDGEGKALLINLRNSLNLVPRYKLRIALSHFTTVMSSHPYLPTGQELILRLRGIFISNEMWRYSTEPAMDRFRSDGKVILSRTTNYYGFYNTIHGESIAELPEPLPATDSDMGEIHNEDLGRVIRWVESQEWKHALAKLPIEFNTRCFWLTSHDSLNNKLKNAGSQHADDARDLLGLSHVGKGSHLFQFDIDLSKCEIKQSHLKRRPHGAANGGRRFRVEFDECDKTCNWGRTVDLKLVRARSSEPNIDGVPELVTSDLIVPIDAVEAQYLGRVTCDPETEDDYFLGRLAGRPVDLAEKLIDRVVNEICTEVFHDD